MASRERDEAMAGLLKHHLAGDAGAGKDCLGPDILAAYFERSLDAGEVARVELHLSGCAHCREQLAALDRAEEAAGTPAPQRPRDEPRTSWIWDWRWLAPVAAVLILTAVWATRRTAFTRIAEQPRDEVALSKPTAPAPDRDKEFSQPSAIAPATRAIPAIPKAEPPANSREMNSKIRPNSAIAGTPLPPPKPAAAGAGAISAGNLPFPEHGLVGGDSRSKKAPNAEKTAKQTAKAPFASANESVAVESAAPATAAPPPAPAPVASTGAASGNGYGVGFVGGVAGGAVAADSARAKQERVATNGLQTQAEILTTTQEQRAPSFTVRAPDKNVLWRIGNAGFIERSEDGGLTWHGTLPKQNAHYTAGSAPSAKVCWLVGKDGIILLTQDATSWQTIPPPVRTNFAAVAARDAWSATVTTADGRKFTTTNQGESWTPAR